MNQEPRIITPDQFSRRSFLQRGSAALGGAALASTLAPSRFALGAGGGDEIKLAIVGCGGRGSGACAQALSTSNLGPVKLVAAADVHEDRMDSALKNFKAKFAERGTVAKENRFIGFDAYKKAISMADVVILSTPPGFRPIMFEEAVRQAEIDAGRGTPGALTTEEREELGHLRREVRTLRMERDILKKATAFFAKENA